MKALTKNIKIAGCLYIGYAIVIAFMFIIAIMGLTESKVANQNIKKLVQGVFAANSAVKMCRIETNIAARNIREMALNPDKASYAQYEDKIKESLLALNEYVAAVKATEVIEPSLISEYESILLKWEEIANRALENIKNGDRDEAVTILLEECAPTLNEAITLAKEIDQVTTEQMSSVLSENERNINIFSILILIILALAILLAIVIAKEIIKSIMLPVSDMQKSISEMSEGNLTCKPTYVSTNEFGEMADCLRNSINILNSYILEIKRVMKEFTLGNLNIYPEVEFHGDFKEIEASILEFLMKMTETMSGIQAAADQVSHGSDQVATSAQELATGAGDQVGVIEDLTSAIDSITSQINQNAENADDINQNVIQVANEMEESNHKMQQMIDAMNKIDDSSTQISHIIQTINDIASQTNLLALNASIEAARAGESGKGFAVVADQVGLLATQSAQAAKSSTELIETSVQAVKTGMMIADETASGMEHVLEGAKSITVRVDEIARTSKEQAEGIVQINTGVSQMNGVVQSNSATSEECAAISEEMAGQADILKDMVSQFKFRSKM